MTDEARLLDRLRQRVFDNAVRPWLMAIAIKLRVELEAWPERKSTEEAVPLDLYGRDLGAGIASSWVFVLRARHDHPAERHPNSIQRMFALDSAGAMEVWRDKAWQRCDLAPSADDPGLSIPANCWHRPARLDVTWGVVSFHTVAAYDLIEEVGDPATNAAGARRHYLT